MSWHPQSRTIYPGGRRAHVVDIGQGPAVLLIHGYMHSSVVWRHTAEALSDRYRLIMPDQLGMGWSDRGPFDYSLEGLAAFLAEILDALEVDRLHAVVGHSLGGAVSVRLLHERPKLSERLMLVASAGVLFRPPEFLERIVQPNLAPLFRSVLTPLLLRRFLQRFAYHKLPVDDEILDGFLSTLRIPGSYAGAIQIARAIPDSMKRLQPALRSLSLPTQLVWGTEDRLVPLRGGRRLLDLIPAAELELIEGCGHCPQEENPARFNSLLDSFLAQNLDTGLNSRSADAWIC